MSLNQIKLEISTLEQDADMAFCNEAARQGFHYLDKIENQDAEKSQMGYGSKNFEFL